MSAVEAEQKLSGTVSSEKNEILFKDFGINYNNEAEIYRKGSLVYRDLSSEVKEGEGASMDGGRSMSTVTTVATKGPLSKTAVEKQRKRRQKAKIVVEHVDIIKDEFWEKRPWILEGR